MSGGQYGRGKAPERRCLPIEQWPASDRVRWLKALEPADVLDEGGARANHTVISNTKAAKGYGRWITYLGRHDAAALCLPPEDRITAERVRAYATHLASLGNSTQTILARLQELGEVAHVMAPGRRWSIIHRIASKIRARHVPARSKRHLRHSNELLALGMTLMDQAEALEELRAAMTYRDGLIIAFLALVPLRRRNLAELRLGISLRRQTSHWLVWLSPEETKTHAAYEAPVPAALTERLDRYVSHYRELLRARTGRWTKPLESALWASKDGSPMTQMAIYDRIRACTREAFGEAITPHLFRDAAATTLAIADPARVRVAAPLLGHRTFSTTERHYLHAQATISHAEFIRVIADARGRK